MTNTVEGLDLSFSWPNFSVSKAKSEHPGLRVVTVYLDYLPNSKCAPSSTVVSWINDGLGIKFNWESSPGRPLLGASAGTADATAAVGYAKAHIAYINQHVNLSKQTRPGIDLSCDTGVTTLLGKIRGLYNKGPKKSAARGRRTYELSILDTSQIAQVAAYYKAAKAVCNAAGFKCGAYGDFDVCKYLLENGYIDQAWQTYAWSGGSFYPGVGFYQFSNSHTSGNASVDYDQIIDDKKLGAIWPYGKDPCWIAPPPAPKPKPVPVPKPVEEDDMNRFALYLCPSGKYYVTDGINARPIPSNLVAIEQAWLKNRGADSVVHKLGSEITAYGYAAPTPAQKAAVTRSEKLGSSIPKDEI